MARAADADIQLMDVWTVHSRPGIQRTASVATSGVGVLLVWAAGRQSSPSSAANWLGVLLIALGILGLVFSGRQTITVDPHTKTITTVDATATGERVRTLRFDDIDTARVGRVGSATSGVPFFFLTLQLRGGGHTTLFAPGRWYPGAMSRSAMSARLRELDRYLNSSSA